MIRLLGTVCSLFFLFACLALADDSGCAQASKNQPFVTPCFDGEFVTYWYAGKQIDPADNQDFMIEQAEGADPLPYEPKEQQEEAEVGNAPPDRQ